MRANSPEMLPSMTVSPARICAPAIRLGSVFHSTFTSRSSFFLIASTSAFCCAASTGAAETISTSTRRSCSARSASYCSTSSGASFSRSYSDSRRNRFFACSETLPPITCTRMSASCPRPTAGWPIAAATCLSRTAPARPDSSADHSASLPSSRASSNTAFAYGRASVLGSAMSDLRRQLFDHVGVRLGVDLALQDLRGARDGELADLLAQLLAHALDLAHHFSVRRGLDALRLGLRRAPGLLDHDPGLLVGAGQDVLRLHAGGLELLVGFHRGFRERAVALVGGRQPVGDLL